MSFRTIKERARRQVHSTMGLPALYRAEPASAWVPVSVRLHTGFSKFGDLPGLDAAQFLEITPKLIFLVEEIDGAVPLRSAIVSIATGEAWRLGESSPPDGITISVEASRIPAAQTTGFPVPAVA